MSSLFDNVLQEVLKFFFITQLDMAFPAQCNQVVDGLNLFGATHAPGFDVVNVHSLRMANFTRDKVGYIVTHAFQICFRVRFDATKFIRKCSIFSKCG
jgi:hypothetical protein